MLCVRARRWVLGGDCAQGLKRALCDTGPMSTKGVVALCRGVAAAYARRHGPDCEPALQALARAAHATTYIDKHRARADFEPLLPRMEAALVRASSLSLSRGGLTLCLSPARAGGRVPRTSWS